jgi:hypothetical protein
MTGNTATISVERFRAEWVENIPIAALCQRWTISKDQVIRLRTLWELPPRHDRKTRYRPDTIVDPTPDEIRQRAAEVRAGWDDHTEQLRRVMKPHVVSLKEIELTQETRSYIDFAGKDAGFQ